MPTHAKTQRAIRCARGPPTAGDPVERESRLAARGGGQGMGVAAQGQGAVAAAAFFFLVLGINPRPSRMLSTTLPLSHTPALDHLCKVLNEFKNVASL